MLPGLLAGGCLLLLVVYFVSGAQSRLLAVALAFASVCCFIFSAPVDTWITANIYPYLGRLLADCFIALSFVLLGYNYMHPRARRFVLVAFSGLCAAAVAIFFSIPSEQMVDRISAHMLDKLSFAAYASAVNLSTALTSLMILLGPRGRREGAVATAARALIKLAAFLALLYVAVRILAAFALMPTVAAVIVSTGLALLLGVGLAMVIVCNAVSVRRHMRRRIAELEALERYLREASTPQAPSAARRRTAWSSTTRLVDLIASTSDRIAALPPGHPVRRLSTQAWHAADSGHNVGVASSSLFATARAVINGEIQEVDCTD